MKPTIRCIFFVLKTFRETEDLLLKTCRFKSKLLPYWRGSKSARGGPYPLANLDRGSKSAGGPNPLWHLVVQPYRIGRGVETRQRLGVGRQANHLPHKNHVITETLYIQDNSPNLGDTVACSMTFQSESREKSLEPRTPIVNPRTQLRIGNWNVRTLYAQGKAAQAAKVMRKTRLQMQSTLALRTPRYYEHPVITDRRLKSRGMRITENFSRYYGLSLLRTPNRGPVWWSPL